MPAPRVALPLFLLILLAVPGLAENVAPDGVRRLDRSPSRPPAAPSLALASVTAAPYLLQEAQNPKLAAHLASLAAAERTLRQSGRALTASDVSGLPPHLTGLVDARLLRLDEAGNVQVYVRPVARLEEAERAVERVGGRVERASIGAGLVQARIPVRALEEIAGDAAVQFVRLPDYGFPQVGSVTTQGDGILLADKVRSLFGVNGAGVKVGVISDGVGGLATSQSTGDLPAVDTSTCNIAHGDPGSSGAEGTAMLEIVHDLAPGAQLLFGHWETSLEFEEAVTCLAQNADAVADDISFFNAGPYDGTSFISANTAAQAGVAGNRVRVYSTSVGNQAEEHYEAEFKDSGFTLTVNHITYRVHEFAQGAGTTDGGSGGLCSGSGGPFCGNTLSIQSGATFEVFLEWNDPFGASTNDYDLFLIDAASGNIVADSTTRQNGHQDPTEFLSFTNNHADGLFFIVVGLRSGTAKKLNMFVPSCSHGGCDLFPNNADLNFNTIGGSVPNEADAGGFVLSVGAIDQADLNHVDIEPFSSNGPTADGRTKPDITAIDGVRVSGSGGFGSTFFGTSAAAPHIAGIAALLLQLRPDHLAGGAVAPQQARIDMSSVLTAGSVLLGDANVSGSGRANALAAADLLELPAGGCTPNATTLCIDNQPGDGRFSIRTVFDAGGGLAGNGAATPLASLGVKEGGLFSFFNQTNPEMLIKVLNGCPVNSNFWVFYAAGTNVTFLTLVTDNQANFTLVFSNPQGTAAPQVEDTGDLSCTAPHRSVPAMPESAATVEQVHRFRAATDPAAPPSRDGMPGEVESTAGLAGELPREGVPGRGSTKAFCSSNATTLCIDGRYEVQVSFQSATQSGAGIAIPLAGLGVTEGGLFWFFNPANPELLIKILDACSVNNRHWVFFSATTNVGLVLTVTDTQTGFFVTYTNPENNAVPPVQDINHFSCP